MLAGLAPSCSGNDCANRASPIRDWLFGIGTLQVAVIQVGAETNVSAGLMCSEPLVPGNLLMLDSFGSAQDAFTVPLNAPGFLHYNAGPGRRTFQR